MVKSGDLASGRAPLDFHYRWEGVGGSAQRLGDQTTGDGGRGEEWVEEGVKTSLLGGSKKNSLPVGGGWGEGEVKLDYWEGAKKITAGGRGVRGRRSENFITEREQRKSLPVGGGWGEGEVKTLLLRESKTNSLHREWNGMKTLLLGESNKKIYSLLVEGAKWKEKWRLYYWKGEKKKKFPAGEKGWVEGKVKTLLLEERDENFVTGREQQKNIFTAGWRG